ncbi:PDZ domain-containing protein [Paeniglutamicibacter antarcticus]|uniref:PDZ domain-containing protein n=1 Tax=Arthrobacter terrae TaxID=2935737 RepID=A0A931CR21_9MICC|nr:S41 family peptidase [Arthrobacter terrae]MBG0741452.1 PDZ domain-containing protein [Arthrobacter terrae]
MSSSSYFRFPHVYEDMVTFVAEDDVWVASLGGGRAWRVSSLQLPARNPRFSPDGSHLVWTVIQGAAPEVVSSAVDGGDFRRLTYFGHPSTKVKGFTAIGDVLVTSAFEQAESRHTWAYAVKADGSGRSVLPYGPVESVAFGPEIGDERPVVVSSVLSREPAWWKRYRGGTGGKLWIDADGSGEFSRLVPELDGNLTDPMWIGDRIAFLSDHEGYGNVYSVRPDGEGLQRHTDHEGFYVRHAATDGQRIVFESAGGLFLLPGLDAEPVKLEITLGSASTGRRPRPLNVSEHLGQVMPDETGRASAVEAHGTAHWLTHRDGPSRILEATPGVRARLVRPLGRGKVIYVADHGGVEALYLKDVSGGVAENSAAALPGYERSGQELAGHTVTQVSTVPKDELPRPISAAAVNQGSTLTAANPAPQHDAPKFDQPTGGTGSPERSQASVYADGAAAAASSAPAKDAKTPGVPDTSTKRIDYAGITRASEIAASPDGRFAAIGTELGAVLLLDVTAETLREVANTDTGAIGELVFSPDSAWLLWAEPVGADTDRSRLRLVSVEVRAVEADPVGKNTPIIELTDGRFADHGAAFTQDGRFIAFLSQRSFDPVYDTHGFDLSFPSSTKPFLIALAANTPSPFGPSVEGTEAEPDALTSVRGQPMALVVHAQGIADRLIPVPVPQGNYEKLSVADGALLWLAGAGEGVTGDGRAATTDEPAAQRLERFDIAKRELSTLVPTLSAYQVTGDGKRILVVHENKVRMVPANAKVEESAPESVAVDLSRVRVQLEPLKVWGQAFDEAWRLQRDFYWTADMAGIDWQGVYDRYRPLVDKLGSHDDLVDLLWEMHGELGTSHAYVTPKPVTEADSGEQGRLGADFKRTHQGWEVQRVLPGESSDPQARSPLAAPGAGVLEGDVLLRIDGVDVPEEGPETLLVGAAEKTVELTVRNGSGHAGAANDGGAGMVRRIAVVPIKDEERLRYQDWVLGNRRTVRQASNERFGYLHVPDMQARGWAQLHRDLDTETAQDGLIMDVRRNRGGHTSQLVAELIGRKMTAWTQSRGHRPGIYPAQAPRGPVVILTDEFAGSDGDIITQVAKLRGIGPVVGMRTWGGVVGIDGKFGLADGTGVTQPRYAFWFSGGVGWKVENYGVDPDIEVPFPPHAYGDGSDPQLEYAVGVLKEMLVEMPTQTPPPLSGYPSRAPGTLPDRPQAQ